MFRTLRAKLIASHVIIIFVCLVLAGSLGLSWLQRYGREVALMRMRVTAQALSRVLATFSAPESHVPGLLLQYLRNQASAIEGELFLVNENGAILRTSQDSSVEGQRIPLPPLTAFQQKDMKLPWRRWQSKDGARYFLLYVPLPRDGEADVPRPSPAAVRYVALAVPAEDVERPWREWLPPLLGIGGLALVISALVSYLFLHSVTQPIKAMTRAAEEMATGHYQQEITVQSQDEIGRLAAAFNRMASEMERTQRAQRDFLVNISHELQTPLTSIRGFSQAIIEGAIHDADSSRRAESIIYEEAGRMGRLVKDLLDLARLEAGQIEMAKSPVELDHLLRSCVEKFSPQAEEAGISLSLELPDLLPTLSGDPDRLGQVFANLVDNALKYTPRGGRVTIKGGVLEGLGKLSRPEPKMQDDPPLPPWPGNDRWVVVTVADTGIGIPPEDVPRIFERFYRADKARAGMGGAGLGLTIAKEIVQAHGGYISATSRQGEGSRFHVLLPVPGNVI